MNENRLARLNRIGDCDNVVTHNPILFPSFYVIWCASETGERGMEWALICIMLLDFFIRECCV